MGKLVYNRGAGGEEIREVHDVNNLGFTNYEIIERKPGSAHAIIRIKDAEPDIEAFKAQFLREVGQSHKISRFSGSSQNGDFKRHALKTLIDMGITSFKSVHGTERLHEGKYNGPLSTSAAADAICKAYNQAKGYK